MVCHMLPVKWPGAPWGEMARALLSTGGEVDMQSQISCMHRQCLRRGYMHMPLLKITTKLSCVPLIYLANQGRQDFRKYPKLRLGIWLTQTMSQPRNRRRLSTRPF